MSNNINPNSLRVIALSRITDVEFLLDPKSETILQGVVDAMTDYARIKCKEQRENCANSVLKDEQRNMKMVSRVLSAISNAPEPIFD